MPLVSIGTAAAVNIADSEAIASMWAHKSVMTWKAALIENVMGRCRSLEGVNGDHQNTTVLRGMNHTIRNIRVSLSHGIIISESVNKSISQQAVASARSESEAVASARSESDMSRSAANIDRW